MVMSPFEYLKALSRMIIITCFRASRSPKIESLDSISTITFLFESKNFPCRITFSIRGSSATSSFARQRPASAWASSSSSLTSLINRSLSSTISVRISSFSSTGIGGSCFNNPKFPRRVVRGVRNSWETSETKFRCCASDRSTLR